ncbi:MAG: glycerophosphodiester phosphodiesterase family protein [Sodaliphilus sp.]|nr:glycerophosphodiester phosphodiesterase family protein [Sodaliphilus sp.]
MKKTIFLLIALLATSLAVCAQRSKTLVKELNDFKSKKVLVVSHRGDWRNAPENSLQAFKNCIDMGVDMIEIDLHKTKDGQLVLMHDNTINRTTDGKGKVSDYTLAELKKLHLRNGMGRVTFHQIPTLEEVLNLSKGKILINIDKGYDYFKDVYVLLEKTGTTDQVVIKSGYDYAKVKADNGDVLNKVIYMPIVNLNKPDAEKMIDSYKALKPVAIECCFSQVTPDVLRLLKKVNENGSKIWINSLWPSLNAGHDDDRAVELGEPDETWGWILKQGAALIQTDRPQALINYLKKHKRH